MIIPKTCMKITFFFFYVVGIQEFRTPVIKNTVFPKWNFFCEVKSFII